MSKNALVTGSTGVIGTAIATGLAKAGHSLVLPVRSPEKGAALKQQLEAVKSDSAEIHIVAIDLADTRQIMGLADTLPFTSLDILINNAAALPTDSPTWSASGRENQFQVNVLSYHTMTRAMLPFLSKASGRGRIVNVASMYHGGLNSPGDLDGFVKPDPANFSQHDQYKKTKQANIYQTFWLHEQHGDTIDVNCCHPGVVTSPVLSALAQGTGFSGSDSPDQGAQEPLRLALELPEGTSGKYYMGGSEARTSFQRNAALQSALGDLLEGCMQADTQA